MAYWDSSALVKLYTPEQDSEYFFELADSTSAAIASSEIALTELLSTFFTKESNGDLVAGGAEQAYSALQAYIAAGRLRLIPPDAIARRAAAQVIRAVARGAPKRVLRALDAIHVGCAIADGAECVVATDVRLRDAATALGLKVLP